MPVEIAQWVTIVAIACVLIVMLFKLLRNSSDAEEIAADREGPKGQPVKIAAASPPPSPVLPYKTAEPGQLVADSHTDDGGTEIETRPVKSSAAGKNRKPAKAKRSATPSRKKKPVTSRRKPAAKAKSAKARSVKASTPDDLKLIKGIGPVIEQKLNAEGIMTFAQIAAWKAADRKAFNERLSFSGRIEREEWVKQARALARRPKKDARKSK